MRRAPAAWSRRPARRPSPSPRRRASSRSSRTRQGAPTSPGPRPATTSRGTCCGCRRPPRARPTRRRGCRGGGGGGTDAARSACGDRARPGAVRCGGTSRAAFCAARTSRANGTCGASAGTSPMASPTVNSSITRPTAWSDDSERTASRGVEDLGEAAARPSANGGERVGEPRRGDQVIRRGGEAVAAQRRRGVDEEAGDARWSGMVEDVAVPARCGDAGGVAGAPLQATIGPRHPGDRRLGPVRAGRRRLAQHGAVGAVPSSTPGRAPARATRRTRPRPWSAPDSAARIAVRMWASRTIVARRRLLAAANRGHRRGDGGERRSAVAAVFDDVLPPALGIRLAGRGGERTDRIEGRLVGQLRGDDSR